MKLASLGQESLALAARGPEALDPRHAGRDFEALLLGMVMKYASRPISGDTPLSGGSAGRLYHELFVEELGRHMAAAGGFGIGDKLQASLGSEASQEGDDA